MSQEYQEVGSVFVLSNYCCEGEEFSVAEDESSRARSRVLHFGKVISTASVSPPVFSKVTLMPYELFALQAMYVHLGD